MKWVLNIVGRTPLNQPSFDSLVVSGTRVLPENTVRVIGFI